MAQGILSGIVLGAVFSVGVAAVISVLVPLEPQPAPELGMAQTVAPVQPVQLQPSVAVSDEVATPAEQPQMSLPAPVSEDLPTEPETAALAPQIATTLDSTVQQGDVVSALVAVPRAEAVAVAPAPAPLLPVDNGGADLAPEGLTVLPQPQTGTAADLTTPRPLPEGVIARLAEDEPVLPNPQALAPMIPDDSQDIQIAEQGSATQAAPVSEAEGQETAIIVAPEADPEAETDVETQTAADEQVAPTVVAVRPRPRVLEVPGTPRTTLGDDARLSIGRPANSLITPAAEEGASEVQIVAQPTVNPADTAPIRQFARPFENPEGKPLMSIVLMDTGGDLDAAQIGLPALSSFPYPVSFAVNTNLPDAAARMKRYRAEGFEVLAIVDLPQAARPTDAEVSLSVALNNLPEIVGVLEGTGEGLQGSREVADQVVGILKASGHGLVSQSKGLNSMPKLAVKEGVPAAPVFRDFDSAGQQPRVIRRFLDQAAFKAGQEGGVVMLGRLRPETIEALLVWGLADRAGSVALAPVSAVLMSQ